MFTTLQEFKQFISNILDLNDMREYQLAVIKSKMTDQLFETMVYFQTIGNNNNEEVPAIEVSLLALNNEALTEYLTSDFDDVKSTTIVGQTFYTTFLPIGVICQLCLIPGLIVKIDLPWRD